MQESEEKVLELFALIRAVDARDPARAKRAELKFEAALKRALEPSNDPDKSTDDYCAAIDEIMDELRE